MTKPLDIEYLRECFRYDEEYGHLYWKERPRSHFESDVACKTTNKFRAGKVAGQVRTGKGLPYRSVYVGKHRNLMACRVMWAIKTGKDAPSTVKHRDGNAMNNRWANLYVADEANRKSGIKGIYYYEPRDKWIARPDGKFLGYFKTVNEAAQAIAGYAHV